MTETLQGLMGWVKYVKEKKDKFSKLIFSIPTYLKKKTKYIVMIVMNPSSKIVKFMAPGSGVQILRLRYHLV